MLYEKKAIHDGLKAITHEKKTIPHGFLAMTAGKKAMTDGFCVLQGLDVADSLPVLRLPHHLHAGRAGSAAHH